MTLEQLIQDHSELKMVEKNRGEDAEGRTTDFHLVRASEQSGDIKKGEAVASIASAGGQEFLLFIGRGTGNDGWTSEELYQKYDDAETAVEKGSETVFERQPEDLRE